MGVPNVFGSATTSIPLSQLDQNFNTGLTIGNTTVGLGNTVTTLGNVTLTNATVSSASITDSGLTSGRAVYTGTGGLLSANANLTYDGTTFTAVNDASISGLTVGKGGGAVATNTAVGLYTLGSNTSGANNVGVGQQALYLNTTGSQNTAIGWQAFSLNTTGSNNTALGYQSLQANTTASNNTAVGYQAGYSNTAANNSFICAYSGYSVTTGTQNSMFGRTAGYSTTTGSFNTFVGDNAGYYVTTGGKNTILGLYNGNQGGLDIRTASNYIVLSDGDGNPRGYFDPTGYFYCLQSYTGTTAAAANVNITSSGAFVRSTSALKYKQDIRDLESIDINKFRPIVYKSKCESDDQTKDHFGFIADEVDEAGIKELVSYGAKGEVEGFQYERFTVVLLKAIQEQQALIINLTNRLNALEGK
jgi:hypothetical protein